jgi:hypothetical protein
MPDAISSAIPQTPNVTQSAPSNAATTPNNHAEPSVAPKSPVPSGSTSNTGQRQQQLLRDVDATIERYAAIAGVTIRPAHGPIGRSINADAVYNKLVQDGSAEAKNFLADMGSIRDKGGKEPLWEGNGAGPPIEGGDGEQLWGGNAPKDADKPRGNEKPAEPNVPLDKVIEDIRAGRKEMHGEYAFPALEPKPGPATKPQTNPGTEPLW